ncbi:ceramide phosphoethanolamine synthase-like [Temnothorax curvispinosus]|uniref:Ceramide phosphoethanolamine synthase-like n=1 Tax=Temnothorax curvispinosus TaxID=300111 RepID=A0A6J1R6C9_9HYME|nr:ceramide phosphoethanolamine synthase-like [Temnothorax curvispinosus]
MCSSTFISKTCLAFSFLLYFVGMDLLLYFRVQDYDVRPSTNDSQASPYHSPILCDLNPICTVTVKAMTLDHPNHYILSPLASLTDYLLGISRSWTWLTPNAISFSHVVVAVIGARYVTRSSLFHRRVGVVLFQVRAWLDNLDGHVARTRLNVKGERSDVGSIGYLVDGVCDGLGCIALTVAVFIFLKRNTNHRGGYERLPIRTISSSSLSPHSTVSSTSFWRSPLYNILMMGLHFCLTSIAWNRYISVYQDLLESDVPSMISRKDLYDRQTIVFRSSSFWTIALAWKIFNFHAMMDYMLLAIFLDRIWEYVRFAWLQLPTVLFLLILISEFHYTYTYEKILSVNDSLRYSSYTLTYP